MDEISVAYADASAALLRESLALSEQLADPFSLGDVWTRLGHLARLRGQWGEAMAAYQRSLRIHLRIDSRAGDPNALEGLAGAWWEQGERTRAQDAYTLAQALRSRTGAVRAPYNERWVASLASTSHSASGAQQWEARVAALAAENIIDLHARIVEFAQ
jgi:tetratricopeptide (TPR) repeat protein